MRETLFNWLQPSIAGAYCLDLFAGTGALGLEALSRYAKGATFVEPNRETCLALCESSKVLGLAPDLVTDVPGSDTDDPSRPKATIFAGTAAEFLAKNTAEYDVVFVDPPFEMAVQWEMLAKLVPAHLAQSALIYLESPAKSGRSVQPLPGGCSIYREKRFGEVHAQLLQFTDP